MAILDGFHFDLSQSQFKFSSKPRLTQQPKDGKVLTVFVGSWHRAERLLVVVFFVFVLFFQDACFSFVCLFLSFKMCEMFG